ncbi:MAG TPA: hypothetical protein VEB40_07675 [Flavipsychrobacter sp.]|nr:hypothetical protein [Flavipsychrobacter sp.]
MQSSDFKKNLLPHILIVAGLAILSIIYCFPALQGKQLYQHDNVSWKAMAHEGMDWHEKTGEPVMWSNSMFGGMPTYTYYVSESDNYIAYIQEAITSVIPKPAYFFFIAMLGFYILMSVLGVNRWLAVVGSIAYAFASYNPQIIAAGHETKMLSVGYMPAILAGLFVLYRGKYIQGAALTGIPLALFVTNAHWQMAYYLMIVIILMVIVQFALALREKRIKEFFIASAIAAVVAVIGVGSNMQTLLTTMEYTKYTMRGGQSELSTGHDAGKKKGGLDKDYAFQWALGIGETFCILVPDLYGGASSGLDENSKTYEKVLEMGYPDQAAAQVAGGASKYWGPQRFLSGPVYFGAIICFLFVLSLFVVKSPHKWWMVAASVVAIVMAWGKHFPSLNYFLFDNLPMLNKFRTPTIMLTIPQLLFPVLGIWALNDAIKEKISREELWKKVRLSVIITGGLCVLLAVGGSMFFDYKAQYVVGANGETRDDGLRQQLTQAFQDPSKVSPIMDAIRDDRSDMAMKSGLISALFVLLAGAVLWAFATRKIKAQHMIIALGILIAIDLIPQANKYLNEENYIDDSDYEALFEPRQVDREIKARAGNDPYYRVLDVTTDVYNDAVPAYHHKIIGGYSPAKLEMYQDMIDNHMNGNKFNSQVLNMLNTRFVIVPTQDRTPMAQVNPGALGNAWFVNQIKWVNTADEEMASLNAPTIGDTTQAAGAFNAATTAVVRNTYKKDLGEFVPAKDSTASIILTKYGLNNLSFRSRNSQEGFAVFSDIWYPDWKAFIDGKEVPIIRTNYILRGLKIPAGEHKIEFRFESESFAKGGMMAAISSILLFGLCIAGIWAAFKSKKEESGADEA